MEFSINMSDKELPLNTPKKKEKKPIIKDTPKPKRERKVKKERAKKERVKGDKKKISWVKVVIFALLTVILGVIGYVIYKGYKVTSEIGFNLNPTEILINNEAPELQRDSTDSYTSVMMIGIDTRENTQLLNTDTIIIARYNYSTGDVTMTSIPRDFHVQVKPEVIWYSRINAVYGTYEKQEEGTGMMELKRVVEEVSGEEIQYYAMIDYNGFVELIDAVGGIYVNVENSFTDYMYPAKTSGYITVSFKEGPQIMDGETALQYARSRHSMHNGEGSDYARARRQQNVIKAFKDTLISSDTLLSPKKIMDLMSAVQNNIKVSEFTLTDIEAGLDLLQDFNEADKEIYSFVLDPNAGNGALVTSKNVVNTGAFAIGPVDGLGNYDDIHKYLELINTDPLLYTENPSIYVYNTGLGYQETYDRVTQLRETFPFLSIKYLGTLYYDKEGTYVYSHSENENIYSASKFVDYLWLDELERPEYITSNLNGEDVTILMGKEPVEDIITESEE